MSFFIAVVGLGFGAYTTMGEHATGPWAFLSMVYIFIAGTLGHACYDELGAASAALVVFLASMIVVIHH